MRRGLQAVLNVNWVETDGNKTPFPSPAEYAKFLREVLDSLNSLQYRPAVIVVENEEGNSFQHIIDTTNEETIKASLQPYIDELRTAVDVCSRYRWWNGKVGVKVTNGGLMTRQLTYATHDWLKNVKNDPESATQFAQNAMGPNSAKDMDRSRLPQYIVSRLAIIKTLVEGYKTLNLSYINIHWHEPVALRAWNSTKEGGDPASVGKSLDELSPGVLETVLAYLCENLTPKVMTNETGQLTTSTLLTANLTNKILTHPCDAFPIAVFYDADGNSTYDVKALHNTLVFDPTNPTYNLRTTGETFRDILRNIKE